MQLYHHPKKSTITIYIIIVVVVVAVICNEETKSKDFKQSSFLIVTFKNFMQYYA
jgi:hypothetical protein